MGWHMSPDLLYEGSSKLLLLLEPLVKGELLGKTHTFYWTPQLCDLLNQFLVISVLGLCSKYCKYHFQNCFFTISANFS